MNDGTVVTYEYLIVNPGCQLRFDQIKGSEEAINNPKVPVGSIYTLLGAYKTSILRDNFQGGNAIFTLPTMPIKCGGAPQKIMYLSEETWRKNGVKQRSKIQYISTAGNLFPNCQKFADALVPVAQSKGIDVTLKTLLTEVDGENRVATFKNLDSGEITK